jgi:hypothetical protein
MHYQLRMNWAGHMASMDRRGAKRVLVRKPEGERHHLQDMGRDGIILKSEVSGQCGQD